MSGGLRCCLNPGLVALQRRRRRRGTPGRSSRMVALVGCATSRAAGARRGRWGYSSTRVVAGGGRRGAAWGGCGRAGHGGGGRGGRPVGGGGGGGAGRARRGGGPAAGARGGGGAAGGAGGAGLGGWGRGRALCRGGVGAK